MRIVTTILVLHTYFTLHLSAQDSTHVGHYTGYFANGNIKIEGYYSEKSMKEGIWKHYYEDGKIKKVEHYKRGSQVGEFKSYYSSGQLMEAGNYSPFQTKKEGVWKRFFENGQLKFQAQYHTGKFCGIYLEYYQNGNVSLKGEYDYFRNTKKGDWIEYYEDGAIKKSEFYNSKGILENLSKEYYPSGNLKEVGDHDYVTGAKDGKWVAFYESGDTLKISYYRKGKQVGEHKEYFDGGALKVFCKYDFSGNLHGPYHEVDKTGEILRKGIYSGGEKSGKWLIRNELGELKKVKF